MGGVKVDGVALLVAWVRPILLAWAREAMRHRKGRCTVSTKFVVYDHTPRRIKRLIYRPTTRKPATVARLIDCYQGTGGHESSHSTE